MAREDQLRAERLARHAAELSGDHVGIVGAIQRDARIREPRDLARYGLDEWTKLVAGGTSRTANDIPADVPGRTAADRKAAFARRLYDRTAAAFPTAAVAARLSKTKALGGSPAVPALSTIVETDPDFDLATARIDAYVNRRAGELELSKQKRERVADDLRRVQRVVRLQPHPEVVDRLLRDGLDSAAAILRMPRASFIESYGRDAAIGTERAEALYRNAEAAAARAFAMYAHFSPAINTVRPPAVVGAACPSELRTTPHYTALFGTLDDCACEPCESVYSPAAYLTDLLAFVKRGIVRDPQHPNASRVPANGLEALGSRSFCAGDRVVNDVPRRPDITRTLLSCGNADTPLPYVDLVLEILENAVSPRSGAWPQTTLPAGTLAAQPEHVNSAAYDTLAGALFPFELPLDLWHEEERLYLTALGTSRAELLETFFPFAAVSGSFPNGEPHDLRAIRQWQSAEVAQARLGLGDHAWKLIANQPLTPARRPAEAWGYNTQAANWWHPLRTVGTLLARTGLNYRELRALLVLRSFNPSGAIRLREGDAARCDTGEMTLVGLDAGAFGYLHRFLRLRSALGWPLADVDRAILALSPNSTGGRKAIDEAFLVRLAQALRLRERFGRPLEEILTWWAPIDTVVRSVPLPHEPEEPSLYDRLFLTGRPGDAVHDAFVLNTARTELAVPSGPILDHVAAIAGALRLRHGDVEALVAALLPGATLDLAGLSLLHRHTSFARALGLRIDDYLMARALIGFDPFDAGPLDSGESVDGPVQTLRFVDRVDRIVSSAFSVAELHYLLREVAPFGGRTIAPAASWVEGSLDALAQGLAQVDVADLPVADAAMKRGEQLAQDVSTTLGVTTDVARLLLGHVRCPSAPSLTAGEAFLDALVPSASQTITHDEAGELLRLCHKASLVIQKLALTGPELAALLALSTNGVWLDPATLPVRDTDPIVPFDDWARLADLIRFRDSLAPDRQPELLDLLTAVAAYQGGSTPHAGPERRAYIDRLCQLTQWPAADVSELAGRRDFGEISHGAGGLLQPRFPSHFGDERLPLQLMSAIGLLSRIGVSAQEVSGWLAPSAGGPGRVARLRSAVRARFGDGWTEVVAAARDRLRDRQRRALVAHLVHTWSLGGADELFDHFLLDVEMSPCMMTSRLVQATAAVQLFVQRVLMNLEPGLVMLDDAAEQWEWMKQYRVWEANRKIFLYPENWIEPDLRDDKTPFFVELERELLQDDLTNDTAETALRHYLEKLHEVARLQVCGHYLELGNPSILHVVARTREVPHHYYYRRGELEMDLSSIASAPTAPALEAFWTPWERVDADIEGDHLIPVVHNRRLFLMWPVFFEKDDPAFSQLEQQIVAVIRFGYLLQQKLAQLQSEVGLLVLSVGGAVISGTIDGLEDGLNGIVGALNTLRAGFSSMNARLNSVSQAADASVSKASSVIRDAIKAFPIVGGALDYTYGEIEKLVESVKTAGTVTFGGSSALFGTSLQPVSLASPVAAATDPASHVANIVALVNGLVDLVNGFATDSFLSLVPAKRLEVQLAWTERRKDQWTATKTSAGLVSFRDVVTPLFEALPAIPGAGRPSTRRLFTFRGAVEHGELVVRAQIPLPDGTTAGAAWCHALDRPLMLPVEIGHFRFDSCNGRMEAVDVRERHDGPDLLAWLLTDVVTSLEEQVGAALDTLHGVPAFQPGEPITADDDPRRPSALRCFLEEQPLPRHFREATSLLTGQTLMVQDVYRVVARHQDSLAATKAVGFFYQDAKRTFFCFPWSVPGAATAAVGAHGKSSGRVWVFMPFYHPYTCALLENLERAGIPGIYEERYRIAADGRAVPSAAPEAALLQSALLDTTYFAPPEYDPVSLVYNAPDGPAALRPVEEFSFSSIGAYADYNWEIFFHIPLLIATRLSTNQKFREAQRWFHYVFNPTDSSRGPVPEKYWRTRPFAARASSDYAAEDVDALLSLLNEESTQPGLQELELAVRKWRRDAFNPHLVARTRTIAFQKAVVMKYIDNLIAWGDSLFRRETRESVNEALQLYVLAAKLLGPRPRIIPKDAERPERTFADLEPSLDAFSNALVAFENHVGTPAAGTLYAAAAEGRLDRGALAPVTHAWRDLLHSPSLRNVTAAPGADAELYFCVPPNDRLLDKWDVVADRLFRIRHCQDIEGQALALPLVAPPIDPAVLVRARANGVDIDTVLSQVYAPASHYRFSVLLQKALDLAGELRALGGALLAAIEKRDAEALSALRQTQELALLEAVAAVKEQQIEEAARSLESVTRSLESATLRKAHYDRLLAEFLSPEEMVHLTIGAVSLQLQGMQFGVRMASAAASLIPNFKGGFVTTLGATYGGDNVGFAAERASEALGHLASLLSSVGGLVSTMGGYRRRAEEWMLQSGIAAKEQESLGRQVAAAEIRKAINEAELQNQKLQVQHNRRLHDFMEEKFTSQALYDWMAGQVSALYFQTYQRAYDMARACEQAFAAELGVAAPGIVKTGYWDSLRKGLLAGDRLVHDLKRLDGAYLEANAREYELTKHVSLKQVDPLALLVLRATGRCTFALPEALFDMDGPGHYFRRIRSVAVTIPCITGPYAGVNARLSLTRHGIRTAAAPGTTYAPQLADTPHAESIATSSAQNDSGLFETNLRDERYLPFENAGAISEWELQLPADPSAGDPRQFDYDTISDVVLHVRYTAREGGAPLRAAAADHLKALIAQAAAAGSVQLLSLRHDFPSEWARFQAQTPAPNERFELAFTVGPEHYPFWSQGRLQSAARVEIYARSSAAAPPAQFDFYDTADPADASARKERLVKDASQGNLLKGQLGSPGGLPLPASPTGTFTWYTDTPALADVWVAVAWSSS